jgi:deoxyguanosine kinase
MVIALEGLPGAGKTTMASILAARMNSDVLRETAGDHPFLAQVYEDGNRDDLSVELAFLLVHANPFRRIDRRRTTVCDFSPAKDQIFAEDMLEDEDLSLFESVYSHLYDGHPLPDLTIYLRAEPSLSFERVQARMEEDPTRVFEAGMTLERLNRMAGRYESALETLGQRTITYSVHSDRSIEETADDLVTLFEQSSAGANH